MTKVKILMQTEASIQRAILDWLHIKKFFFWRSNNIPVFGTNNAGQRTFRAMPKYSLKGIPDIIVLHRGKFIGLEVKRPLARLSPEQIEFATNCGINGGVYYKVESLEDVLLIPELQ